MLLEKLMHGRRLEILCLCGIHSRYRTSAPFSFSRATWFSISFLQPNRPNMQAAEIIGVVGHVRLQQLRAEAGHSSTCRITCFRSSVWLLRCAR